MGYKKYFLLAIFIVIIGSLTYFYFGYKKDIKFNSVGEDSQSKIISSVRSTKPIAYISSSNDGPFKESPSWFFNVNGHIYFFDDGGSKIELSLLENVDPTSFKAISREYGTDGVNLFYKNKIIKGADLNTFYVVGGCGVTGIDNKHVYTNGVITRDFTDANPRSAPLQEAGKTYWYNGDC